MNLIIAVNYSFKDSKCDWSRQRIVIEASAQLCEAKEDHPYPLLSCPSPQACLYYKALQKSNPCNATIIECKSVPG